MGLGLGGMYMSVVGTKYCHIEKSRHLSDS